MRPSIGLVVLLALLAGCDAAPRASGTWTASAVVEILPPSAMPEGAHATAADDAYFATAIEKIRLPQTILRAVRDAKLTSLPSFEGRSEDDLAREIADGLEVRQRGRSWLVEIAVSGGEPSVVDDEANAVAAAFVANESAAARSDIEIRRAEAEDRLNVADTSIRLLEIDKVSALKSGNFTQTTIDARIEDISRRRRTFGEAQDEVAMKLILSESKRKGEPGAPDERKELGRQKQAFDECIRALDADFAAAAAVKGQVDRFDAEIARRVEARSAAMRELEILAHRTGESARTARIVAPASEPAGSR